MPTPLVALVASVAALGGVIYGFDSGIIATTLGHDSFKLYMYGPSMVNTSISGAIVSVYNAGQGIGSLTTGYLADKISRKWTIFLAAFLTVVGSALQAAAVNAGMLIAGRLVAGIGCGEILSVVPIYLAEVSPLQTRGFLVGFQGMMIAIGFGLANWVGYAGSFASGNAQWRIPLAMQLPVPFVLMAGLFAVPYSPRWLIQQDRHDDALRILEKFHPGVDGVSGTPVAAQELIQIREQINLEREQGNLGWTKALKQMFSKQYVRRTVTAAFIISMGQLSGSSVLQNFQSIFYAAVGFTGQRALLIAGVYGMMGIIGQIIYLVVVADRWPRVRTLWTGSVVLSTMIAICMALSSQYGSKENTNESGAQAAIAFIFLFSMFYAIFFNAMIWVVPSELFPFFLRSKGLAFAVFSKAVVAIVLSQITPVALANVSWRYYSLFIATNMAAAIIYFFFLPETGGKSLEEIAEIFGDTLATEEIGKIDVGAKIDVVGRSDQVENVHVRPVEKDAV